MGTNNFEWDFFIAHDETESKLPRELYELLETKATVFLGAKNLILDEDWEIKLAKAQCDSLVTVILISVQTDNDFYNRKDVAAAIRLAREYDGRHRVVPIYMSSAAMSGSVPSSLRLKHGITLSREPILSDIVTRLLNQLTQIQNASLPTVRIPSKDLTFTDDRNVDDDKTKNVENSLLQYDLSREARKALNEALLSAYPKLDELTRMVRLELGENLDAIVEKGTLKNTIFGLIEWAEATGHLIALVQGAHQYNRGNPKLVAFCEKFMTQ